MSINEAFKLGVLIPCYNHGSTLPEVIDRLREFNLDCLIVNDGSCLDTEKIIKWLERANPNVSAIHLSKNSGKGVAVTTGAKKLAERGYTHFLQIDADGQHSIEDIPKFLELAKTYPQDVISGMAVYDESVPKARIYGKYITNFWVTVETKSKVIKDAFCGFRVYPLSSFLQVVEKHFGHRMDFDIEILVRLYWQGVNVRYIPTVVYYPAGGISNFNYFTDNLRISCMHTRLVCESMLHLTKPQSESKHWADISERKGMRGFRFLLWTYRRFGSLPFRLVCRPVVFFFWLTGSEQRKGSKQFLDKVKKQRELKGMPAIKYSSLSHFNSFADSILLKLMIWTDKPLPPWKFKDEESERLLMPCAGRPGKLILVSHIGCSEASRAIAENSFHQLINALVYEKNSPQVKQLLEQVNPDSQLRLMQIDELNMGTAVYLEEAIKRGEWVAIAADRVPVGERQEGKSRTAQAEFLGEDAFFPTGPYLLGALLKCETIVMYATQKDGYIVIEAHDFAPSIKLDRDNRDASLSDYVEQYAKLLESKVLQEPLQWFNFYNFWSKKPEDSR